MLSDHALSPSGVGVQSRFLANGLVDKGRWTVRQLGAAIKHDDYSLTKVAEDFLIKPVDGFGTPEMIRSLLASEKPDIILLFTDPRFFVWLWQIEDEIHQICPIAYWHVWDNKPYPDFNDMFYKSTDLINCHSHHTYTQVKERWPERTNFIPHSLPSEVFYRLDPMATKQHKVKLLGENKANDFVLFWVNRNAKRKRPADILESWSKFLNKIDNVAKVNESIIEVKYNKSKLSKKQIQMKQKLKKNYLVYHVSEPLLDGFKNNESAVVIPNTLSMIMGDNIPHGSKYRIAVPSECPHCRKVANTLDGVVADFGLRIMKDGSVRDQSWCNECRWGARK